VTQQRLHVVPCDFSEAVAYVRQHHRHHRPPVGHKFSLAVADNPALSEACVWLAARWPVVMTMAGRLRSHDLRATGAQTLALASTVLRGVRPNPWDIDGA